MGSNTPSNLSNSFEDTSHVCVISHMRDIHQSMALQAAVENMARNDLLQNQVSEAASCTTSIEIMDRKFNHWIANVDTINLFPDALKTEILRHTTQQNFPNDISNRVQTNFNWLCEFANNVASFWKTKSQDEKKAGQNIRRECLKNLWDQMKPSEEEINELIENSKETQYITQPSTSKSCQSITLAASKPVTAISENSTSKPRSPSPMPTTEYSSSDDSSSDFSSDDSSTSQSEEDDNRVPTSNPTLQMFSGESKIPAQKSQNNTIMLGANKTAKNQQGQQAQSNVLSLKPVEMETASKAVPNKIPKLKRKYPNLSPTATAAENSGNINYLAPSGSSIQDDNTESVSTNATYVHKPKNRNRKNHQRRVNSMTSCMLQLRSLLIL